MGDRSSGVAGEEGQSGTEHRHLRRQPSELDLINDDPIDRCIGRAHQRFDLIEQCLDAVEPAARHQCTDPPHGQHGAVREDLVRERVEPRPQRRLLSRLAHRRNRQLDELRSAGEVLGGQGMGDGLSSLAVALVPVARPPVQHGYDSRLLVENTDGEDVGEQVVVAVPLATVVERDDEQVRSLQRLEHRLARRLARDGIAERSRETTEDRRVQQETADLRRLAVEHLVGEVVDDEAIVACEVGDERGDVVTALQRQGGELQRGDPSFGADLQCLHLGFGQREVHHAVQVRDGFVDREAEVCGADLEQFTACTEATERPRRVGPGCQHQMDVCRKVFEDERRGLVHLGRIDEVVVIEDDDQLALDASQVVQERCQHTVQRRCAVRQQCDRILADVRRDDPHGGDDVGPEEARVGVTTVERDPRHASLASRRRQPLTEQRRLPESGRRRHERERREPMRVELVEETRPPHDAATAAWGVELRLEQRNANHWRRVYPLPCARRTSARARGPQRRRVRCPAGTSRRRRRGEPPRDRAPRRHLR